MCTNPALPKPATMFCIAVLATILGAPPAGAQGPQGLDSFIFTERFGYSLLYKPTNPWWIGFTSDADAQAIADHFDPAGGTGLHEDYLALSFREVRPLHRTVSLQKAWLTGGRSNVLVPFRIVLDTDDLNAAGHGTVDTKGLCAHELHHSIQFEYVPWGLNFLSIYPVGIEGPACAMEDAVNLVLDDPDNLTNTWGYSSGAFLGQVYSYLSSGHQSSIWSQNGYSSCLFWKYLMEQFGSERTEPGVGVDFLRRFYTLIDENKDGLYTTLEDVLDERDRQSTTGYDPGVSLAEVFQDFSIANWTRRYQNQEPYAAAFSINVPDPQRFFYLDENSATPTRLSSANLADPSKNVPKNQGFHGPLAVNTSTGLQTGTAAVGGAAYYECGFAAPPAAGHAIGFWAQAHISEWACFSVVGIRQSGVVDLIEKGSVTESYGGAFQLTVMQPVDDPYTSLVAVVNGRNAESRDGFTFHTTGFDYYFSYFSPTVEIQEPHAKRRAYVGSDGSDPDRFQVRVRVTSPDYLGAGSVTGLTPGHFTVAVGNSLGSLLIPANHATVMSAAYVMGEYWLTCKAPPKSPVPTGFQTLWVSIGSSSDYELNAVSYSDLKLDEMLVIDRSGSMKVVSGGVRRVDAARTAAQLFIDAAGSDDQIGVARFNGDSVEPDATPYGDAQVVYPLQAMNTQFERDLVSLLIDDANPGGDMLEPQGGTALGDGLFWGAKEIIDHGEPGAKKWIVLLSDGHQNEESFYAAHKSLLLANGIRVESIALGSGVDNNLLQKIAHDTGGRYYDVSEPDPSVPDPSEPDVRDFGDGSYILLELADRYLLSSERIHERERVHEGQGSLAAGASTMVTLDLAEGGLEDCVVTLFTDQLSADPTLMVIRPDSSPVPPPDPGYTSTDPDPTGHWWDPPNYVNHRIAAMADGRWTFHLANAGSADFGYRFVVSGKSRKGVQSVLHFSQLHGVTAALADNGLFLNGLPQPIVVTITDQHGPVRGADVVATVTHPAHPAATIRLRDDGGANDGRANDGVYAGVFTATVEGSDSGDLYPEDTPPTLTGSYAVRVVSGGMDNSGREFQRVNRAFFHLYTGQSAGPNDSDGDGMPNRYEERYSWLDPLVPDADGDYDGDGLTNGEEFRLGTDPGMIDTDGGGETDKSECDHGSNPLDGGDDALIQPRMAGVRQDFGCIVPPAEESTYRVKPGQNLITYSVERSYDQVEIFRSPAIDGPYSSLGTIAASGVHIDSGLANGVAQWYYIQPMTADGKVGAPSLPFDGTPRADVIAPWANLLINGGVRYTTATSVALRFQFSPDAVQMKLARTPDLSGVSWVPVVAVLPEYSLGTPVAGERITLHGVVRDAEGNESVFDSSIIYLTPDTAGRIIGTVVTSLDVDNSGARVSLGHSIDMLTPASGIFNLVAPSGSYDLAINARGYEPVLLDDLALAPDPVTDVGTITLVPLDSDGDGLPDVDEMLKWETNRRSADSDGDGFDDRTEVMVLMTDPNDPNSLLRIELIGEFDPATRHFTFTFQSVPGLQYRFRTSGDLSVWSEVVEGGAPKVVTAEGPQTTVSLVLPPGGRGFVQVVR